MWQAAKIVKRQRNHNWKFKAIDPEKLVFGQSKA